MTINFSPESVFPSTLSDLPSLLLLMPQDLENISLEIMVSPPQFAALDQFKALKIDADAQAYLQASEAVVTALRADLKEVYALDTAVQRAQKFNTYDEFFNVHRTTNANSLVFLHGLFLTFGNALKNMGAAPHQLTCIELPLLRVAIEAVLDMFSFSQEPSDDHFK